MTSITIFCSLLILLSLTKNINGQTCHGKSQYDLCSSNSGCGCLQLSISNDVSICGILGVSCSRLQPCQSPDDTCEKADHVCVHHPRCNSQPLCYPLSMIDHRLCPPSSSAISSVTTTTGAVPMTTASPSWNATGFPSWNTTAFQTANTTASPSWNATGFPSWNATASPSWNATGFPTWNATASPSWNATGFPTWNATASPSWNVTGSTPTWNATAFQTANATGSTPTWNATVPISTTESVTTAILSYYSHALTIYSAVVPGTINQYYQAINIRVHISGLYTFTSKSYMNTFGVLYKDGFNPMNLSWYLVSSINTYDSNHQFRLSHNLNAGSSYTLLLTTYSHAQTGAFTVISSGPGHLQLF